MNESEKKLLKDFVKENKDKKAFQQKRDQIRTSFEPTRNIYQGRDEKITAEEEKEQEDEILKIMFEAYKSYVKEKPF